MEVPFQHDPSMGAALSLSALLRCLLDLSVTTSPGINASNSHFYLSKLQRGVHDSTQHVDIGAADSALDHIYSRLLLHVSAFLPHAPTR